MGGKWKGGKKRVLLAACTRECFKLQLQLHTYWGCNINIMDDGDDGDQYYYYGYGIIMMYGRAGRQGTLGLGYSKGKE